jgi:hypothetical protein
LGWTVHVKAGPRPARSKVSPALDSAVYPGTEVAMDCERIESTKERVLRRYLPDQVASDRSCDPGFGARGVSMATLMWLSLDRDVEKIEVRGDDCICNVVEPDHPVLLPAATQSIGSSPTGMEYIGVGQTIRLPDREWVQFVWRHPVAVPRGYVVCGNGPCAAPGMVNIAAVADCTTHFVLGGKQDIYAVDGRFLYRPGAEEGDPFFKPIEASPGTPLFKAIDAMCAPGTVVAQHS